MSLGPWQVGEQPTDPLLITVTDSEGAPRNLDVYDTVTVEGLPEGVTTVASAVDGKVQYTFTAPFAEAGTVSFRVTMASNDDPTGPDVTPWISAEVSGVLVARATPAQAFAATAQQVSAADLQLAQVQIALVVDRDLAEQATWDAISPRDQKLLTQAISWQAVELNKAEAAGLAGLPGSVQSMSTAGQSVTFASGTSVASMTNLSPVVVTILNRLSWKRRQLSAYLENEARGPAPDPWIRQIDYVVGHNFGLYVGTLP